jgi:hypothetical protein
MRTYQTDFAGWAEDTANALAEQRFDDIDFTALIDEVRSMGRQEQDRLTSRLTVLFVHLLKCRYQPEKRSRSWELSILEARRRAKRLVAKNPSLQSVLAELIADAYGDARLWAARETRLDLSVFPVEPPFTDADVWGD